MTSPTKLSTLTLGQNARPSSAVLARDYRLTLHHVLGVTVELDDIAGPIRCGTLRVPVHRCARILALHLWRLGFLIPSCTWHMVKYTHIGMRTLPGNSTLLPNYTHYLPTHVGNGVDHSPVGKHTASALPRIP